MEEGQPTLSTSAETIRNLPALQIPAQSSSTSRRSHSHSHPRSRSRPRGSSRSHPHSPSSPHSPWSPSSPSGESVSSLPSVGSSFLFSSVPASPPHYPSYYPGRHEGEFSHNDFGEGDRSLIIPSLTLPSPLRPPTTHGHALERIRLLVVNSSAAESSKVADEVVSLLSDHNYPELVHVGQRDDLTLDGSEEVVAQKIRMSTDWIEHREANEEDRYESSSNIELVHLREYDSLEQPDVTLNTALSIIQASFHAVSREYDINTSEELLTASTLSPPSSQHHLSSALISSLLNPSSSGDDLLFTAVIVVPSSPPSPADDSLIVELRKYIPVIVLTTPGGPQEEEDTPKLDSHIPPSPSYSSLHLSNSRLTCSPSDIRTILYQNTHALSSLRKEAAELFLLWAGFSPQSVAKALELSSVDKSSDSSPRPFDPRDSDDVREQVQGREPDDRLDGTVKARTSTQYPYQPHQSDRESPQTRRGSTTKAARDRNGCTGASTGSGTLRGRPRGQTMERRKTITAATHPRPVVGPLARLDSLVQSQSQSTSQPSSASAPPVQSRRRRYAAEHGLSTGSTTVPNAQSPGYGHPLPPSSFSTFDPLHIPSLIRLAVEGLLLGPLRLRLSRLFGVAGGPVQDMAGEKGVEDLCTSDSDVKTRSRVSSFVPIALIAGAFCAGVGVGIVFTRAGI